MGTFVDLSKVSWETNSDLWQVTEDEGGRVFQVGDNSLVDHVGGKVLLFNKVLGNYRMRAELRFLGHNFEEGVGGWFGFVMRAIDTENYELVWFMPNAEGEDKVAYLSVAHGLVPWWTEAYACQEKGACEIHSNEWFRSHVEVMEDKFSLYVEGGKVLTKKLTYYLSEGYPGFYVGTATDAAFRRVKIEKLE